MKQIHIQICPMVLGMILIRNVFVLIPDSGKN